MYTLQNKFNGVKKKCELVCVKCYLYNIHLTRLCIILKKKKKWKQSCGRKRWKRVKWVGIILL